MLCPECRVNELEVLKVAENTYRIECTSISCYFVEEFEHVVQERELTPPREYAMVGIAR